MDRLPETKPGVEEFQVGWPIPPQAPTGLYTLTLHVEDRIEHLPEVTKKVRGFVVYKKLVRISRVTLDKTIYNVGEPIKCEVGLENLSDTDVKGLRVEFSNANYPWISLYFPGRARQPRPGGQGAARASGYSGRNRSDHSHDDRRDGSLLERQAARCDGIRHRRGQRKSPAPGSRHLHRGVVER